MKQNLIFDADDTLWENNVLFEQAVEAFIDYAGHATLSRAEVRARLDEIERVNVRRYGYGVDSFERSLTECLGVLRADASPSVDADGSTVHADAAAIRRMCEPIRANVIELIDGVLDTLHVLSTRHRLFLLTKGDQAQQAAKIEASGLADLFADVTIVPEKEPAVYARFVGERQLAPDETWMIGNSPKSDIRPALEAGLGAVLVPHPMTWTLEHDEVPHTHERFREVTPFAALSTHF
ncbi:HAD family hydrolase [Phytoactinopolyspora halotolerans]|uniref:HAD hydrolase-like protein n=1 Tax=Phytoactinopolyspora halotolerans TaxID=1981512 RepID=A0A6L9SHA2_9ACTN|nr:HAD family hydrolase [Phytoactinopolyspora halotolerans]NEE04745.1 HAD hydrolase-like protein [Phytoactinopolyspora halotolerans]